MKNAKKETTAVAVLGQNDVPTMLEQVNAQIKSLKGGLPNVTETTGQITGFGMVKDINSVSELIKCASSILGKESAYKNAAKVILGDGFKVPVFTVNGMTVKSLIDHLKARVGVVYNQEKLKTLNKIKKTLEDNLTAEAKLANDLNKIAGMMDMDIE